MAGAAQGGFNQPAMRSTSMVGPGGQMQTGQANLNYSGPPTGALFPPSGGQATMNDMSNTGMTQGGNMQGMNQQTQIGVGGAPIDPMQQASMAQQAALAGTAAAGTANIGTIAGSDIAQYQNPYTEQVIKANEADILRGAQMGLNTLDAQAQAAKAFGGSRHGVALGEYGRGVAEQLAQSSAGLRQSGFQQAQQMAQSDIQNRLAQANLGLGAASQLGMLGQQSFGYGTQIADRLQQQGSQEQLMQQALIDAAKAQFAGYTGAPSQGLGYVTQALGAVGTPTTTTATKQPGVFDYLTLGATAFGGR